VHVSEDRLSKVLCGRSRPGHFSGVLTIVTKLFNLIQPDLAVFGEKDAQQLRLIQKLVADLNFPIRIIPGPITREVDGLAMSSRNAYLSKQDRLLAKGIFNALEHCRDCYHQGETEVTVLRDVLCNRLAENGLVDVDYAEILDSGSLSSITRVESDALVAVAVKLGSTRLIDNLVLKAG
jgi:pantoate--beta-alanine ligase